MRLRACAVFVGGLLTFSAGPAGAQQLPLHREIPAAVPRECTPTGPAVTGALPQDPEEAARLVGSAREAALLGDARAARDLLERAARLDTLADNIAFLHARTLEDLGEAARAADEYCRYAALTPDSLEAQQVRERVSGLAPAVRPGIPDSAADRFSAALAAADAGRLQDAEAGFSAVILAAPAWPAPHYNRGLLRARRNAREEARSDLARYIELEPTAPDGDVVRRWIAQLAVRPRTYSATGAFLSGLIPGVGHFSTGRPAMGLLVAAVSGGAAAFGLLHRTNHVECLGTVVDGVCPPDQVLREYSEQPYLAPALGVAVAATVLGAVDAARGARRRNERGVTLDLDVRPARSGGRTDLTLMSVRF